MSSGIPNGGEYLEITEAFGHWFAGFTDGEGCFYIAPSGCRFIIGLRGDDDAVVREIQATIGYGRINIARKRTNARSPHPQVRYEVARKAHCAQLTTIFDRFPLKTKKANDYAIWREASLFHAAGAHPSELFPYRASLIAARAYREVKNG